MNNKLIKTIYSVEDIDKSLEKYISSDIKKYIIIDNQGYIADQIPLLNIKEKDANPIHTK